MTGAASAPAACQAAGPLPPATPRPAPLFQPFSLVGRASAAGSMLSLPAGQALSLAETTRNIADGVATVLAILGDEALNDAFRADADEPDPHDRPLFSAGDRDRLLRLAMASANLLAAEAGRFCDMADAAAERLQAERQACLPDAAAAPVHATPDAEHSATAAGRRVVKGGAA